MPIETLDDIITELADRIGVYGCGDGTDDHKDDCDCRICFGIGMRLRITKAIELEKSIEHGEMTFDDLPTFVKLRLIELDENIEVELEKLRQKAREEFDEQNKVV